MILSALAAVLLAGAGESGPAGAVQAPAAAPYRAAPAEPLDFRGPGRDAPEPEVAEVVIGWFGPGDPAHPDFGDYWRGATLALEQENAAGGYRGRPFRLEAAWSESPWTAGILGVTRLVYDRGAWAVIGGVSGTTTHLAVQLALKSHFTLLSPGSTDDTADDANVPWLFSLPPSDATIAEMLAEEASPPAGRLAVVAGADHDAHAALVALRRALGTRRAVPAALVEVPAEDADLASLARAALASSPTRVVVLASPVQAAAIVRAVRAAGFGGRLLGGAGLARAAFARAAGAAAEGVAAPALVEPTLDAAFAGAYEARWGEPPDAAAALGADAVRVVAAAVRAAGLNRARIRDAVRALSPWSGASGRVSWNPRGRNERRPALATWHGGRLVRGSGGR
ncbi:MAG: ABC transporter substrate-binding protein [Vicinamibacteria bacterium]